MGNVILEIARKDETELEAVRGYIREHRPRTVGLQLPEDYFQRPGAYGWDQLFFGTLGASLRAEGREVVPLENPELLRQRATLLSAKAAGRGIVTGTERDKEFLERYGLEGVERELAALEEKRVVYIVGRVQQTRPEVIILNSVFRAEKAVRRVAAFQRPAPV